MRKQNYLQRILASIVCMAMLICLLPVSALASDPAVEDAGVEVNTTWTIDEPLLQETEQYPVVDDGMMLLDDAYAEINVGDADSELQLLQNACEVIRQSLLDGIDKIYFNGDLAVADCDQFSNLGYYCPYMDGTNLKLALYYYEDSDGNPDTYAYISLTNKLTAEETKTWINTIDTKLLELKHVANSADELSDKALLLHDYMDAHYHYDTSKTIYYPAIMLTQNTGVCQCYAYLFQFIMNNCGYECYYNRSTSMKHAWNVLRIGDNYYHIDVTYDDPTEDFYSQAYHSYFLLSDTGIQKDHSGWSLTYECNDASYEDDYFVDATSPVVLLDGKYYYVDGTGFKCYEEATDSSETIYTMKWPVYGMPGYSYTNIAFAGLFSYDGKLYFNSYNTVLTYDPETEDIETYANLDVSDGYVFGLLQEGSSASYALQSEASVTYSAKDIRYIELPEVDPCAAGHTYNSATFNWEEGYTACTASATCSVCNESVAVDCEVEEWVDDDGNTHYLATAEIGGETYTDEQIFEREMISITYDPNGGDGEMEPIEYDPEELYILDECTFTREGYSFTGWNTEADGSGESFGDEDFAPEYSTTLYAQWMHNDGWFTEDEIDYYYVDGEKVTGIYSIEDEDGDTARYIFDEDSGAFQSDCNGVYTAEDGNSYWANDGIIEEEAGLKRVELDDGEVNYYYFVTSDDAAADPLKDWNFEISTAVKNVPSEAGVDYWITKTNELLPEWGYYFDENGVILHDADTSKNGILSEDGALWYYIDGIKAPAGLIQIDDAYYYVQSDGKVVADQSYYCTRTNGLMDEGAYSFDADGKMVLTDKTKQGIISENGSLYYYVDGEITYAGLIQLDGSYYYVRTSGEVVHNCTYWISKTNNLLPAGSYTFDAEGKMQVEEQDETKEGFVNENGEIYYYQYGVKCYAGLILVDGNYYYVNSSYKVIRGCKYWISKTNNLLPEGSYTFDADGKMINPPEIDDDGKDGIIEENGSLYYYVDNVLTYAGLVEIDGSYYYVRSSGEVIHGCSYWISKTNGIMAAGSYAFAADGKMVLNNG